MAKDNPEKAERLAQALRDNLRRRKTQARERQDDAPRERLTDTPRERDSAEVVSPPEAPSRD